MSSVGKQKQTYLTVFLALWLVAVVTLQGMPYLHSVILALPSYLAVTLGSKIFLTVGYKMYNLPLVEDETASLQQDVKRATEFLKQKKILK